MGGVPIRQRVQIPEKLVNEIMVGTWHTCCVCRVREKVLQIHHIDEDASNNDKLNLVALCHDCHNKAHLRGGTGRHLTSSLIRKHRDEWYAEVIKIREEARERLVKEMCRGDHTNNRRRLRIENFGPDFDNALVFIRSLPQIRLGLLNSSNFGKAESTYAIVQASNKYIDSLHELMILIARHYSPDSFDGLHPEEFISQQWQERQRWARGICTPMGEANSGTMVLVSRSHFMIGQAEQMVMDLVQQIFEVNYVAHADDFGFRAWKREWEQEIDFAGTSGDLPDRCL